VEHARPAQPLKHLHAPLSVLHIPRSEHLEFLVVPFPYCSTASVPAAEIVSSLLASSPTYAMYMCKYVYAYSEWVNGWVNV
jgi:hypothetical protein